MYKFLIKCHSIIKAWYDNCLICSFSTLKYINTKFNESTYKNYTDIQITWAAFMYTPHEKSIKSTIKLIHKESWSKLLLNINTYNYVEFTHTCILHKRIQ